MQKHAERQVVPFIGLGGGGLRLLPMVGATTRPDQGAA
jgi:hypothetical protein